MKLMKQQLEMSLEAPKPCRRPYRSQQRRNRARWWFNQMRVVVENAIDWRNAPQPPPEQTYLSLVRGR